MKIFVSVLLFVGYVTAGGSGPYLPSGWKPTGPAFYLPSEVEKPAENPIKDLILEDTEPAGSDGLREYGPPKVQEVSQDISNQGLPDTIVDQTFVSVEKEVNTAAIVLEASSVEGNKEEKVLTAVTEVSAVTEAEIAEEKTEQPIVALIEDRAEVEVQPIPLGAQPLQDSVLESTERVVEATVVSIEAVVAEEIEQSAVTESEVSTTQELESVTEVSEAKAVLATQVIEASKEVQEIKVVSGLESAPIDKEPQIAPEVQAVVAEELKDVVSEEIKTLEEVKSTVSEETKAVEEIKSAVSEEIKTVEAITETVIEEVKSVEEIKATVSEEVKAVEDIKEAVAEVIEEIEKALTSEEVKAVEEVKAIENVVAEEIRPVVAGVNNIAQALQIVESEIKAEQAEKATLELAGSLAEAPEGFLEYGPPGFREYGPPKGDDLLRTNALEQELIENNEARRRRFSPKFRPTSRQEGRKHP
ncbi:hypothetical protein K1T71_013949 [Dendrolimus kikuchii]|uniref:Uncharacterized protein n=1 Tax=Dendrolimus kikuchii TaxID=765133 RepID=A0ACC1CGD2_9NEOP|nr:hypothetical protein K1T71_013949 [Dendrolimus kikuchii]